MRANLVKWKNGNVSSNCLIDCRLIKVNSLSKLIIRASNRILDLIKNLPTTLRTIFQNSINFKLLNQNVDLAPGKPAKVHPVGYLWCVTAAIACRYTEHKFPPPPPLQTFQQILITECLFIVEFFFVKSFPNVDGNCYTGGKLLLYKCSRWETSFKMRDFLLKILDRNLLKRGQVGLFNYIYYPGLIHVCHLSVIFQKMFFEE